MRQHDLSHKDTFNFNAFNKSSRQSMLKNSDQRNITWGGAESVTYHLNNPQNGYCKLNTI